MIRTAYVIFHIPKQKFLLYSLSEVEEDFNWVDLTFDASFYTEERARSQLLYMIRTGYCKEYLQILEIEIIHTIKGIYLYS